MLKGKKELDKAINNWLKENGFDGCKVKLKTDFGYKFVKDVIEYALVIPEEV